MPDIKAPNGLDFSKAQDSWSEWKRRFERYRSASGLSDKPQQRQVDTLVYIMGEKAVGDWHTRRGLNRSK